MPAAVFDERGILLNANEAIGELVNTEEAGTFEGYWKNPEASAKRVRHGILWSGDLAYRDEQGYFYFAGRGDDWLRVDGENIASAQVEELAYRHPDVLLAAVYAVPDPQVGDRVMLAVQPDCSPKWVPRFVRVRARMPVTATTKVVRRELRAEWWRVSDPVWWRPEGDDALRPMTDADIDAYERTGHNPLLRGAAASTV